MHRSTTNAFPGGGKRESNEKYEFAGDKRKDLKNSIEPSTFISFDFLARLLRVLVNEAFIPSMWVPPSTVRMLLAYPSIVSEYASEHLE